VEAIALLAKRISHQNAPMLSGASAFVNVGEILGAMLKRGDQELVKPRPAATPGPSTGPLRFEDSSSASPMVKEFIAAAERCKAEVAS
jgi:hypothetical protein